VLVEALAAEMRSQFEGLHRGNVEVRADIAGLCRDNVEMRGDIAEIRGDITEIRLCKHGWENQQTTWGKAGPLGCIGVTVTPTCES